MRVIGLISRRRSGPAEARQSKPPHNAIQLSCGWSERRVRRIMVPIERQTKNASIAPTDLWQTLRFRRQQPS